MKKVGKNIGFASRVALCHLLKRRYPLSVTFITTYRCNFRCRYCDVWTYKVREMDTLEVLSMMDEFAAMGTRRFSFNGGEALLREDIGELVAYSKRKGFFTTLFSNGVLVPGLVDKLKPLDILSVSLDGPGDVHDAQRMKGTFEEVVEGIRAAKAAGINVWTNTVLTKENLSRTEELVELASGLGVRMIFQPVLQYSHSTDSGSIDDLAAPDGEYARAVDRLKELKRKGAPIVHSDEYLDYIKVPLWSENPRRCWAGELYCAVTPSGEVAPCYPVFNSGRWPSGVDLGFRSAFEKASRRPCTGCYCALVETDFLYSLRIGAVVNLLKSMEGY